MKSGGGHTALLSKVNSAAPYVENTDEAVSPGDRCGVHS